MLVGSQREAKVPVAEIMVPCIYGAGCHPDWAAVAAVGGWAGALAATFAAGTALWLSTKELRKSAIKEETEAEVALVSLYPLLHKAQADLATVCHFFLIDVVPDKGVRERLLSMVEGVDGQLEAIQALVWKLDSRRAVYATGVIARARMGIHKIRRIALESNPRSLVALWAIRGELVRDARISAGELLELRSQARNALKCAADDHDKN